MKKLVFLMLVVFTIFMYSCSKKQEGIVPKIIHHEVIVERDGKNIKLEESTLLKEGDVIKVKRDSQMDIVLSKDDIIRLKPNTEVKVKKWDVKQAQKQIEMKLKKGKVISKLDSFKSTNSSFSIGTNYGVCGIRGTIFEVEGKEKEVNIYVVKGRVNVKNEKGEIEVPAGKQTTLRPGAPPSFPQNILKRVKPFLSLEVTLLRPDLTVKAAQTTATVFDISTIQRSLEYYRTLNGRYPSSLKEAQIKDVDAWGVPLVYFVHEDEKGYTLFSAGPDRIIGTTDDINLVKY